MVVDLERKKPIALLPDRSKPTVVQWLKRYPTINIVARDRSKEFAAAITEALPHAQHVADRWHVAKNLTEHLDTVVSRCWKQPTKAEVKPRCHPNLFPFPLRPVGPARLLVKHAISKCSRSLRQVF
jgi:transposase